MEAVCYHRPIFGEVLSCVWHYAVTALCGKRISGIPLISCEAIMRERCKWQDKVTVRLGPFSCVLLNFRQDNFIEQLLFI